MPLPDWTSVAPQASCLAVCSAAAACDLRSLRIPNRLTYPAFAFALVLHLALGFASGRALSGLWPALGWGLGLFALTLPAALSGLLGMGDAKLLAVVGAFLPGWLAVYALLYTGVCGGALALLVAGRRGLLGQSLRNLAQGELRSGQDPQRALPYGVAIGCGTLWSMIVHGGWLERLT